MSKNTLLFAVAVLCTISFVSANAHAANLIVNGSFEQGTWLGNYSWYRVAPGSTDMTGWIIGGAGIDWHNSAQMVPQNGTYVVDLNLDGNGLSDTGTISQSFPTNSGTSYTLSFYLANPYGHSPSIPLLNVNLNGTDYAFNPQAWSGWTNAWVLERITFQANASSTAVTFSSLDGSGYWGPVLDNVSAAPTVPEPGSMALLSTGLVGVVAAVRRKLNR
jgi:choice-of-anchor C domain-containing protein